ncbi:MAG: hypothetical protein U9O98_01950, partial [Asgard group archaeon]|nr:hypothetical protein [Asgard group archaeon]
MVKTRRYLIPRINQAEKEFKHLLDEGLVLVQALILQQSGTNSERFKTLPIRNVSIDSLNDVLVTLKNLVKK